MIFHGLISKYRSHRRCLGHVLSVAFFFKGLIPPGFMPEYSPSDYKIKIVICSENGMKLVDADENGFPLTDRTKAQKGHEPCAMSGLSSFVLHKHEDIIEFRPLEKTINDVGIYLFRPSLWLSSAHRSRAPPFLI